MPCSKRVEIRSNRNNKRQGMKRVEIEKQRESKKRERHTSVYLVSVFISLSGLLHRCVSIQLVFFPLRDTSLSRFRWKLDDGWQRPMQSGIVPPVRGFCLGRRNRIVSHVPFQGQRTLKLRQAVCRLIVVVVEQPCYTFNEISADI